MIFDAPRRHVGDNVDWYKKTPPLAVSETAGPEQRRGQNLPLGRIMKNRYVFNILR